MNVHAGIITTFHDGGKGGGMLASNSYLTICTLAHECILAHSKLIQSGEMVAFIRCGKI